MNKLQNTNKLYVYVHTCSVQLQRNGKSHRNRIENNLTFDNYTFKLYYSLSYSKIFFRYCRFWYELEHSTKQFSSKSRRKDGKIRVDHYFFTKIRCLDIVFPIYCDNLLSATSKSHLPPPIEDFLLVQINLFKVNYSFTLEYEFFIIY